MKLGALAFAVQGALAVLYAMPAHADDDEAAALKTPANFVEIGVANVSRSSAKFGEYSGLNKSGGELIGNFSIRGGDAYGEEDGIRRWAITGTDVGLTSRALGATMSDQGKWSLGIGYDELRHNITDTYQTPYQGSMGGNNFVLPAGFGVSANTNLLTPAQKSTFQTREVSTTRKNTSLTAGYSLNPQWSVKFDYNHLDQSGAKLMAFASTGGANLAAVFPGVTGQAVSILPNPTNYKTDTVNLALNWVGDNGHMTTSYSGSFFRDGYDRVTFQTFAGANSIQTMSTAPSNNFQQLNLSGGYALSPSTKLSGGLSYGRNTQNDTFAYDTGLMVTPTANTSLNGLVVNTHADLKLTNQTTKDLVLSAGLKYDERDNRTSSSIYNFNSVNGAANTVANYPNTPFSNKKTQLELAGDYRLGKTQRIRLAYDREEVKRWCNQYAVGVGYPAGTNCVVATASKDDKLSATYKLKASNGVDLSAGYAYSDRKTDSDPLAITAMIGTNGNPIVGVAIKGLNGGDFLGFKPFFDASRRQQQVKAGVNWQATDTLSFNVSGRYTDDKYTDATYGVQKGNSWSLNIDATYNYDENITFTPYLTQQHRERDMTNQATSAVSPAVVATVTALSRPAGVTTWSNMMKDDDITFGLGAKRIGMMGGKLDLTGDLTYSVGKTSYGTQLNYASATTGGLTCNSPSFGTCGTLPDFKSTMTQLKLTGNYKVDKQSTVALGYLFQKLSSDDWFYNPYQTGFTANATMPTNQQSGSYVVNVVAASYIYNFK